MKPLKQDVVRCEWARNDLAIHYHDHEWGVPHHDDRALFELLILEGAQAGLSWDTILKKRDNYRVAKPEKKFVIRGSATRPMR